MRIILSFLFCIVPVLLPAQTILVQPYIQPGNAATFSKEQKVLIWQTDSVPGNFRVTYQLKGSDKVQEAKLSHNTLHVSNKTTRLYRATLSKLKFDTVYTYEVKLNGTALATHSFSARSKKSETRFAVLGDFGGGTSQEALIAYQIYLHKPQFVLTTGDNVYQNGREAEYRTNLFPHYLAKENDPMKGVSLMNTIPFYMLLGNHDVRSENLDKYPDGMAYFYYSDLPLNAPLTQQTCPVTGTPDRVKEFRKNTKPRFPRMANFSFDYGNVHITCLDANDYVSPLDPMLIAWMKEDIGQSRADWKIVAFHHPGFNSSEAHYDAQLMRLYAPLFETLKVDLVLTGHVHNYQRSVPLLFAPKKNEAGDQYIISPAGRVDGAFTLDTRFDGESNTTPNGIIYIVTGAGGATLYDPAMSQKPELWKRDAKENWVPFTHKLISHIHSFTWIETKEKKLTLQQVDLYGNVLDQIKITK